MKTKLTMMTGCFILLMGLSGVAAAYDGDCSSAACGEEVGCSASDHYGSCFCADPSCGSNDCLSGGTCCAVFGNVGGYTPEAINDTPDYQYVSTNEFAAVENTAEIYGPPPVYRARYKGE